MLEKHLDTMHMMLQGIISILLGAMIIASRGTLMYNVVRTFGFVFAGIGFLTFFDWLLHPRHFQQLLYAIVAFGLAIFVLVYPNVPMAILPLLFSVVLFLHMATHFITMVIFWKNHLLDTITELLLTLFYMILFSLMFLEPLVHLDDLLFVIGGYLIMYGIGNLRDALYEEMKVETKNRLRRKVRLPLPVLFAAIIPHRMLTYINRYFEENEDEDRPVIVDYKENVEPDIEVLIHVTNDGFGAFGHVDICYHNYIISYGNYDAASMRLHEAVGDGVLFVAPKDKYIPFCIADSKKTLFGFGMILTDEQKKAVNQRLKEFFDNLHPWLSPYAKAEAINDKKMMEDSLEFYASRLYQATKAKMYKFNSGPFKTYFVMKTNCVALADAIIGKTGIDIVGNNGIISPGTYYDYFNLQFLKSHTNVITRTIYH